MSDWFERDVVKILAVKSKDEIQRVLANSDAKTNVHQTHLAALRRIVADETTESEARVEERHQETLFEDRFARKIAFVALLVASFSLGVTFCDRHPPAASGIESPPSPPERRTTNSEGLRSSTTTPSSSTAQ